MAYDPKKTGIAALKFGLISAASVFLADQAGLTQYLLQFVPAQYASVAPIVIGMGLSALKNWITNKGK